MADPTNKTAKFAQNRRTATAIVTAAAININTDSPTGLQLLLTVPAGGGLLTKLTAIPRATVTASSLLLYLSKDGVTFRLFDSELMNAYTLAATTKVPKTTFGDYTESTPGSLEEGDRLYVGSQVALAAGIVFKAEFSDFIPV